MKRPSDPFACLALLMFLQGEARWMKGRWRMIEDQVLQYFKHDRAKMEKNLPGGRES